MAKMTAAELLFGDYSKYLQWDVILKIPSLHGFDSITCSAIHRWAETLCKNHNEHVHIIDETIYDTCRTSGNFELILVVNRETVPANVLELIEKRHADIELRKNGVVKSLAKKVMKNHKVKELTIYEIESFIHDLNAKRMLPLVEGRRLCPSLTAYSILEQMTNKQS
jgi:hypothetical protein